MTQIVFLLYLAQLDMNQQKLSRQDSDFLNLIIYCLFFKNTFCIKPVITIRMVKSENNHFMAVEIPAIDPQKMVFSGY